jgi:hypothetical protein
MQAGCGNHSLRTSARPGPCHGLVPRADKLCCELYLSRRGLARHSYVGIQIRAHGAPVPAPVGGGGGGGGRALASPSCTASEHQPKRSQPKAQACDHGILRHSAALRVRPAAVLGPAIPQRHPAIIPLETQPGALPAAEPQT